tara:strand:- start:446 stop:676 length:231 start_codon:yes stop_codon:yes gene_type:complete
MFSSSVLADEIYDRDTGKYLEIKESVVSDQVEVYDYENATYKYYDLNQTDSSVGITEIEVMDVQTNEHIIYEIEED